MILTSLFSFSESLPSHGYSQSQKEGDTILNFELDGALTEPAFLFVMGCFDEIIYISAISAMQKSYLK